jgi:predicted  nucleic acid-binding Zn-ribbon protein
MSRVMQQAKLAVGADAHPPVRSIPLVENVVDRHGEVVVLQEAGQYAIRVGANGNEAFQTDDRTRVIAKRNDEGTAFRE